jgi:phosphatidylserine synthase
MNFYLKKSNIIKNTFVWLSALWLIFTAFSQSNISFWEFENMDIKIENNWSTIFSDSVSKMNIVITPSQSLSWTVDFELDAQICYNTRVII